MPTLVWVLVLISRWNAKESYIKKKICKHVCIWHIIGEDEKRIIRITHMPEALDYESEHEETGFHHYVKTKPSNCAADHHLLFSLHS